MAATSTRAIAITYANDVVGSENLAAAQNTNSPASITIHSLTTNTNTIVVPTGGSSVAAATIVPPFGNTQTITLKGTTSDAGIVIASSNPTSLAFGTTPPTNIILDAGDVIEGLRIFWT